MTVINCDLRFCLNLYLSKRTDFHQLHLTFIQIYSLIPVTPKKG